MALHAIARAFALTALLALPISSHALFRAYLSSTGDDANPCTRQEPCRLLPAALAAVDDEGEIWILDSANYNTATVQITKGVTILAVPGALGSIVTPSGSPALNIDTPDINVSLRNLVVRPLTITGTGNGVRIGALATGTRVRIESTRISRLGIAIFLVAEDGEVVVSDSVLLDNAIGVAVNHGTAHVSRCRLIGNSTAGVYVQSIDFDSTAHVTNTVAAGNGVGFQTVQLPGGGGAARMYVRGSTASDSAESGFMATAVSAAASVIEVSDSVSHGNAQYGFHVDNGTITSAGNNRARGNNLGASNVPLATADSL